MQYDYIIIGSGVAGLYTACNIEASKKVLIISKNNTWECNTFYAQGGISTAVSDEDEALHISDTLQAGANMCDKDNVSILVQESRNVIKDLIARGFHFDTDDKGALVYTKEAAHSANRILHAGGDATGRYVHHFLLSQNTHAMLSATVVDLLIDKDVCYGVQVVQEGVDKNIYAKNVIIASGGLGALYEYHTNARSISGDIQGIAVEHGLMLANMEMMQFHPTVYVGTDRAQKQLLSEALRGEGATIVNEEGERFVYNADKLGELAPRDIVSRAIFSESQKGKGKIYLDFSNFERNYLKTRFPNIYQSMTSAGFNLPLDRVPISPAFHYAIGGIKTDSNAQVLGMKNLYCVGEAASTGVHGANRLASNSLLEGLVFAKRAISHSKKRKECFKEKIFEIHDTILIENGDGPIKKALRQIMWQNVGIVRSPLGLQKARKFINSALAKPVGRLLKLRLLTAKAVVDAAIRRKESIGVHYVTQEKSTD